MTMEVLKEGKAWKFGDNISTDLIAPGRYTHLRSDPLKLAEHVLEDAEIEGAKGNLAELVNRGDYVVAGKNFGLGSSREHAPLIIKLAGVSAVLAKSFARIFFRNAINVGLPVIQCDTDEIDTGDILKINLKEGYVEDLTKGLKIPFHPLPDIMVKILNEGGLIPYIQRYQGFKLH
jgi:3-isopropylmalate/(R)-2-methylmalate dehydratase small subunit